jgi:hypothetical protein
MKVIFMDTRYFSMARTLRRHARGSLILCLVAASSVASFPAFARDADDAMFSMHQSAPVALEMAFIRPEPKPEVLPVAFPVTRATTRAAVPISAPEPVDHSRIRPTWAIGVFR